ncbi:hypothetical protein J6590_044681 [Homalodisca vitripennis]|nr:hypothetical protein J6590_044681 [Homalodisca vitripennis]
MPPLLAVTGEAACPDFAVVRPCAINSPHSFTLLSKGVAEINKQLILLNWDFFGAPGLYKHILKVIMLPYTLTDSFEKGDPDAAGCDTDLSEEIKMYKSCLVATPATTTRHLLLAVLAGALLLAVVVIVCWWRKGRTKKNSVQDQKRTDKNTKVADTLIT